MGTQKARSEGQSALILDVYGRVSQLIDERQRSVEGQVKDCKSRVQEYGAHLGEVLTDPGRSAWNQKVRRPGWDTLMDRLEAGISNGVVVWDLSRFSRRPADGERLIKAAERGLLVLDSEDDYDLTAPNGKKAFRDQLAAAAYYSDRLSTVVRRGKREKALKGEPNATRVRAFGFEPDQVTVREAEAEVIREVARRLLDAESPETLDAVTADLNARGIRTSAAACTQHRARGGERCLWCGRRNTKGNGDGTWKRTALKNVLLRSRNAGFVTYKGADVARLPGEPILDAETWSALTALFASRRRGRPISETYLCSGIALCGLCRHRLSGRPRNNMKPYQDGGVRRQYYCQPRVGTVTGCGRIAVDQREMDAHVRVLVATIMSSRGHATQIEEAARAAQVIDDEVAVLEGKIAEAEHTANELAARLGRGEMLLDRYDAAAGPLERRLAKLRDELTAAKARREQVPVPEDEDADEVSSEALTAWLERWDAATTPERRGLLRRALRGRALVVGPVDVHAPRKFDSNRVTVEPRRTEN